MALRCFRDILDAFEEGRVHQQPFMKGISPITNDGQWLDWAYTAGKPAYSPRVGTALQFVPEVATGNDAVYFPPIPADQERRLAGLEISSAAAGSNQIGVSYMVYDLLGYYPLIDGDSAEWQDFINLAPLPRYADGRGVRMALQQYIAPQSGIVTNCTVDYVDDTGASRTTVFQPANVPAGSLTCGTQGTGNTGALSSQQSDGALGVRSVTRLKYAGTPMGGLQILLLYKQIATGVLAYNDPLVVGLTARNTHERCLCGGNGFHLPRIYDGASLGIMYMKAGSTIQLNQLFGHFTFIWG